MKVVLGIDAAWTPTQPSGVAIASSNGEGWQLIGAYSSYGDYFEAAKFHGSVSDGDLASTSAVSLINAATALAGQAPDLVAFDMPMSLQPITGRRGADQAISKAYGAKWCAAHSPSAQRPGQLSDQLRAEFASAGYGLCVRAIQTPGLVEVYPHPALVELCGESKRLPYKVTKAANYWPRLTPKQRRAALIAEWNSIATVLEPYLAGAENALRGASVDSLKNMKAAEDMLDAIVCCVSAIRCLEGEALAYSADEFSAIWVPNADVAIQSRTLLPSSQYSARSEIRVELFADRLAAGEYPELIHHGQKC
jgi:predicted RNase H-like nuclease